LYVTTSNVLLFFLFYEFLLLPSFLFVYFVSPSRRAIQASIYFVIWTQLGSFLVLAAISYIVYTTGSSEFDIIKRFTFSELESYIVYSLLFFGFGFKVPIWPFHYWLTKTHVEAPSGFSIYLSGFLVKSALYGFYKLSSILSFEINTSIFILITLLGVFDSSLKMWGQTDIKKLVAYGTIQEMNLIYLVFCWGDSSIIVAGIIFTATHAFLSCLMFYLVDCVYRRYHTRSIVEVNGILHITPNLGISILLMTIFFAGLPGTIKFISEFYIFSSFLELSPFICIFLMLVANVIGLIGFSKVWFNLVFGSFNKYLKYLPMDLSYKEIYIAALNFLLLFFITYTPFFFY
jgi:NADH-quinone oxidoreductase subunit M